MDTDHLISFLNSASKRHLGSHKVLEIKAIGAVAHINYRILPLPY